MKQKPWFPSREAMTLHFQPGTLLPLWPNRLFWVHSMRCFASGVAISSSSGTAKVDLFIPSGVKTYSCITWANGFFITSSMISCKIS
ncbi:hypothetical protein KCU81_g180, partial [Aureobasidium melanogenum]